MLAVFFLAVVTCWLYLPIVLLLPLSLFFAFRFYKATVTRFRGWPVLARLLGLVPLAIPFIAWQVITEFLSEYQA